MFVLQEMLSFGSSFQNSTTILPFNGSGTHHPYSSHHLFAVRKYYGHPGMLCFLCYILGDDEDDVHICGSCRAQFNDVNEFVSHKKYKCPVKLAKKHKQVTTVLL